ncbi:MAG: hypothetical protein WBB85_23240 [Albidovulum sp.]|uniref:hypothetical protein n=1 Tax=Albidovulum sp. TaxID=1872424 RepID=UPI003C91DF0A
MRTAPLLTALLCATLAGCGAIPGLKQSKLTEPARADWPALMPTDDILQPGAPETPDPTEELEARAAALKARAAALAQAEI